MRIDSAKYFVVGMTVAGALCVAAMMFLLTIPTYRDLRALAVKLSEAEGEVQAQYANRKQLSDTIDRLKAAKAAVAGLSQQFVPPGDELAFIEAIENVKEYDHTFSLAVDGPYRDVLRAIVDIERLPMITVIQSVGFHAGSSDAVSISMNGLFASTPKGL